MKPLSRSKDVMWVFLRMVHHNRLPVHPQMDSNQVIPFWYGYNHCISERTDTYTAVPYAPIVDNKPADMSTVYTVMKQSLDMCKFLGQPFAVDI